MEQYRAAENEKSDDSVAKGKKSMAAIHDFVTVLEKYEDKLPDNLQDEVEKFVKAAKRKLSSLPLLFYFILFYFPADNI